MLWLVVLLGCSDALARDHIVSKAWLEDVTGELQIDEIKQLPAQPFSGPLTRGFGQSVIWLRLRIDPFAHPESAIEPDRLLLRVRPVYLDEIRVFDPLAEDGVAGVLGDRQHPRDAEFLGLDFLLPIARGDAPRDIWLRLSTTSTRQIDAQVINLSDHVSEAHAQATLFSLYLGLTAIIALWALIYWLLTRDRVIGAFALAQWAALGFALTSLGYTRLIWPDAWAASGLDYLTSIFSILGVSCAVIFHVLLIREYNPPRWLKWVHAGMVALLPIKIAMMAAGHTIESLQLNMAEVLWSPMVFLMTVMLSKEPRASDASAPVLPRKLVIAFYVFLVVILAFASLPGLGLIAIGDISLYIVQVHGLVTGFLLMLLLQYRNRLMRAHYERSLVELERTRLEALHSEQLRDDQDRLFCMLAHEIKTPLATMQMRIGAHTPASGVLRKAIRDINSVLERCVQSNRFEHKQLTPRMTSSDLVKLTQDCIDEYASARTIRLNSPATLVKPMDRQFFSIVLDNLLENAVKYAAPETPIDVELSHDPATEAVRLVVSNTTGAAGSPDPDKVFDKYYRSPLAQRHTGTGLGLYIVQNLVSVLGGQIQYVPADTQVTFICRLPIKTSQS